MIYPRRIDGSTLRVTTLPDGRVFADTVELKDEGNYRISRGGPEHSRHFHRFEDYGLEDGLVRCRKCGLVKEHPGGTR